MNRNDLIKKWLDQELDPEEQKAFEALDNRQFLEEIVEEGKRFKASNKYRVASFEDLEKRLNEQTNSNIPWTTILFRVAAVFVVGLGLYALFNTPSKSTITTQLAEKKQVILPDSSVVNLNELSLIAFSDRWDKERKVQLKGEAYFRVAKGKRFDVTTDFGTVSVLGTQFNVNAKDSIFSVICYEGLVQVVHNNKTTKLSAGKAYEFTRGVSKLFDVPVSQPEWLSNMKVFKQTEIQHVFASLEHHYNVTINTDSIDNTVLFSGAFELDHLENALLAITKSLQLTYEIKDQNKVIIKNAKE
jgi:ferric-dicitrate binding protein FerR (iron transport regulator)